MLTENVKSPAGVPAGLLFQLQLIYPERGGEGDLFDFLTVKSHHNDVAGLADYGTRAKCLVYDPGSRNIVFGQGFYAVCGSLLYKKLLLFDCILQKINIQWMTLILKK